MREGDLTRREQDRERTPLGVLTLVEVRTPSGETGYEILLDGAFLMGSHGCHSERLMARLAWERLPEPREGLRVLIGGLGAGHTLRAVLDLPGVERVVVAEIGRRIAAWNRGPLAPFNGHALDDSRVSVRVADVAHVIRTAAGAFDLVLLDVDNGPGWLAAPANAWLYSVEGLAAARAALRPGGVLALWSPQRNPGLERHLDATFPGGLWEALDTTPEARREGEPPAVVYLALRGGD